jgi:hypothetical protein
MERKQPPVIIIIFIAIAVTAFILLSGRSIDLSTGESNLISEESESVDEGEIDIVEERTSERRSSQRQIFETQGVKHSIPVEEIQKGCFGRDCIPSVDEPKFISKSEADEILPEETLGIGLNFLGESRFYPFNMLVTREIVNDEIDSRPFVVTYCPLCGTGIVFDRKIGGKVLEFGVSGMLWQSNLLMYNRDDETNISLWSQVLGEAVLGPDTGEKLSIIPSDIVMYKDWAKENPNTQVLNTGRIGDPYGGDYYGVAKHFDPSFDEETSPILPTEYIFGIEVGGKYKAYVRDSLPFGVTDDSLNGVQLRIDKSESGIVRISSENIEIPIVTGFWFSWAAAHPETEIYE